MEATNFPLPLFPTNRSTADYYSSDFFDDIELDDDDQQWVLTLPHLKPREVAAGVAIATFSIGTIAGLANHSPQYEGNFQLSAKLPQASPQQGNRDRAVTTPTIEEQNQTIALPDAQTQIRVLQSQRLLNPVIDRLREKNVDVDYDSLSRNLHIAIEANQRLNVRYRDTNPETVEAVLEALFDAYLDYSRECQTSSCRGIDYLEQQLPPLQKRIEDLRQEIRQFHERHQINNIEAHTRQLSDRSAEVMRQSMDIDTRLAEARTRYLTLQERMNLKTDEAIAPNLLRQDLRYQTLLMQFRQLEAQIAGDAGRTDLDRDTMQLLHSQHQMVMAQLNGEAQQVLKRYMNQPGANLQDPIYQEPIYLELLQQSIATVHYVQVLQVRRQTLGQTSATLKQQKVELASILRRYSHLRQELHTSTEVLQQSLDRRAALKQQVEQEQVVWKVDSAPQLMVDQQGNPVAVSFDLKQNVGTSAALGALLGLGIAAILEKRRRAAQSAQQPNLPVDSEQPTYEMLYQENFYKAPHRAEGALTVRSISSIVKRKVQVSVRAS